MGGYVLVLALVSFTGADHQAIDINPNTVVTVRDRRDETGNHFAPGIRCLIHTIDGKIVYVIEACDTVRRRLRGE